jgi:hypothetical protein
MSCPGRIPHVCGHVGSGQAMFVDFGYAERYGGRCYLRFDDTNPEAEKQEYIDHIQDIVSWLGYTPYKARSHAGDTPPSPTSGSLQAGLHALPCARMSDKIGCGLATSAILPFKLDISVSTGKRYSAETPTSPCISVSAVPTAGAVPCASMARGMTQGGRKASLKLCHASSVMRWACLLRRPVHQLSWRMA